MAIKEKTRMENVPTLPKINTLGFYEMRFESIGGLGANLAGQILSQAAVLGQGLNGAHFSSYGSEKKGSPVKSYVRLCLPDRDVRTSSPVEKPHLLAIFHYCLLKAERVVSGLYPDSAIVVNSPVPIDEENLRRQAGLTQGALGIVDALDIAEQEKTRINSVMLGAVVRVLGFIDPKAVKEVISSFLKAKYPKLVTPNLKAFERGYAEVNIKEFSYDDRFEKESAEPHIRYLPELGYANAPLGGTIINPGNTAYKDLSASRQGVFPLYHRDRCIDCGLCTMTCPDFVYIWQHGVDKKGQPAMVMKGPNYQYCKGCLKCVEICPSQALTAEHEQAEFTYTADAQLLGPPDALVSMSRHNEPAIWERDEGHYWHRVS